ncbi:MAG: LOG family protein [Planctomycetes bacterium]|nr:LOG family protein [Planctomycetota bacterium]
MPNGPASRLDAENRTERDKDIHDFASRHLQGENQDLYEEMMLTVCRLARDGCSRGDVKLLHKALAELRYGFRVFAPYRETRKISIFGSSRTPEHHPDYKAAVEFARRMGDAGWMVITGAGDGIMKAGHGGAGREASFGVAIRLPFEQKTNEIIAADQKLVNFRYFFTRKLMFLKEASAIALFPGGFGTQDEGFEALTLVQTGKAPLIPIVMIEQTGGTYWPQWRAYVAAELLRCGMIGEPDMGLFKLTDSVDAAVQHVLQFYRVFHSSRYVNDDLVLRIRRPLPDATLTRLNDQFARLILAAGRIEQTDPLPEEQGELPALKRIRLRLDKKNIGHLRRMIDVINLEPAPAV